MQKKTSIDILMHYNREYCVILTVRMKIHHGTMGQREGAE